MTSDTLEHRAGLPEPLRLLLDTHPRESWKAHPDFHGLVSFWLERHIDVPAADDPYGPRDGGVSRREAATRRGLRKAWPGMAGCS